MYAFFIRVKLQSQSMVQNLDPKLALKKKLEHRAQQNHEHHWFGRAWPAQCGSKRWPGRPVPQALNIFRRIKLLSKRIVCGSLSNCVPYTWGGFGTIGESFK